MADSRWWKDFDAVLAAAVPAGSRILDVRCGDGGLVDRLAELGFDVFGVDPAAPSHQRLVPVRVEDAQLLGEPGGGRGPSADLRRHYSGHRPHQARHLRQPDHDEPVAIPLDVLVQYRRVLC